MALAQGKESLGDCQKGRSGVEVSILYASGELQRPLTIPRTAYSKAIQLGTFLSGFVPLKHAKP